jgi:uncharacterized iron-regulated protein
LKTHQILIALTLLLFISGISALEAQQADAFKLFNEKGRRISYKKMVKSLAKADVILFGELHNDPIAHFLQRKLIEDMAKTKKKQITLGAEMFEADNQVGLTSYLNGDIDNEKFTKDVRLWPNYETDYKPLVEFAKNQNIPFIATNVPRRFASMVFRGGFDVLTGLTEEEKSWIATQPVPYDPTLPAYVKMLEMGGMGSSMHSTDNFPKAQAIKDATMAHFICRNFVDDNLFIHFNGSYHSDNFEGIMWYINQYMPTLKVITITTVLEKNPKKLTKENKGKANFTISVDENMTRTY